MEEQKGGLSFGGDCGIDLIMTQCFLGGPKPQERCDLVVHDEDNVSFGSACPAVVASLVANRPNHQSCPEV